MVFRRINRKIISQIDWQMIVLLLLLCAVGLTVLYSAGFDPDSRTSAPFSGQAKFMAVGFVLFLICMVFTTSFWRKVSFWFYAAGLISLVLVLTQGVVVNGARRWVEIGGIRVQPSEFMKLGVILALARVFSSERAPRDGYTILKMFLPVTVMIVPAVLVIEQPDLGTALTYLLIGGSMLLVAGVRFGTLLRLTAVGLVLVIPAWKFMLKDYQRQRVLTFLSPEVDPLGAGYHAI
ncbi:MAG TPA: FtsW/RodA/SpoVE family cell cycle protein, partial [Oligoflexia bacterium]|nr:FtsW/RodA/SpoVE family cell cycle protein [Oligoflexia bacterium]